ncbi:MAG: hypothetical protein JXB48_03465 [Candidatus Latescibacteria bacterium]|nr:hypothetical protein [Candidatus Latescibacterota bacterium]
MKRTFIITVMLMAFAGFVEAQLSVDAPTREELEVPVYPGATFIRIIEGLDPYYKSAMYVTLDPMRTVEIFYEKKLPEKMKSYFEDENRYMTIFLLKTWSSFSGKPAKEELDKLEHEPNIQVYQYNREFYNSLIEYYDARPDEKYKADALRTGKTIILYTYKRVEKNLNATRIIGTWQSTDRDLPAFYKSTLTFNDDGTYAHTFTAENIETLIEMLSSQNTFKNKTKEELLDYIRTRNPEKGTYVIMRNTITLVSENPIIEPETKSGLARVKVSLLSLELINLPRLSLIRVKE